MFFTNLFQSNLKSQFIIKKTEYYPATESTMSDLWELINEDNSHVLVITDNQKNGKGRLNNKWHSKPGCSLTCSFSLNKVFLNEQFNLHAILIPVAIIRAIKKLLNLEIKVKWPNDLFYENKKVGGILIESKNNQQVLNIGIGLNVNEDNNDFPNEIKNKTTSLKIIKGHPIQREPLLAFIINEIEQKIKSLDSKKLINIWQENCIHINENICFKYQNKMISGIFKKINLKGQAVIEYENKHITYDGPIDFI